MKRQEHEFGEVERVDTAFDGEAFDPITYEFGVSYEREHRRCKHCGLLSTSLNIGAFYCDPADIKCFKGNCDHDSCGGKARAAKVEAMH